MQWAPIFIPVRRRIQTAAALFWVCSLLGGGICGLILTIYLLFSTSAWPLVLVYLIYLYLDWDAPQYGGRKVGWVRRLPFWKYFVEYFPLKLIATAPLPPDKNYLMCVYPHGLLCAGMFGHFATESSTFGKLFPGLVPYCATLNMHFGFPFFRDYILGLGFVSSSRESLQWVLGGEKGRAMVLVVGGASESLYARPGSLRIILKNRKGFVRLALKTGSPLVPVFSFGENDLYEQVSNPPGSRLLRLQQWLKRYMGLAPCLPIGRGVLQYSVGPVPRRRPVTTVVGAPVDVPLVEEPTREQVDEYHAKFTEALVHLFEAHKKEYLPPEQQGDHLIIE